MTLRAPRLFADARGVWREDRPGQPFGISWDELYRIGGHKLDGITEVYTVVVLDFEFGEFIELYHDWPGFGQVARAITERVNGIEPLWFEKIERLGVGEPPIEVWKRG